MAARARPRAAWVKIQVDSASGRSETIIMPMSTTIQQLMHALEEHTGVPAIRQHVRVCREKKDASLKGATPTKRRTVTGDIVTAAKLKSVATASQPRIRTRAPSLSGPDGSVERSSSFPARDVKSASSRRAKPTAIMHNRTSRSDETPGGDSRVAVMLVESPSPSLSAVPSSTETQSPTNSSDVQSGQGNQLRKRFTYTLNKGILSSITEKNGPPKPQHKRSHSSPSLSDVDKDDDEHHGSNRHSSIELPPPALAETSPIARRSSSTQVKLPTKVAQLQGKAQQSTPPPKVDAVVTRQSSSAQAPPTLTLEPVVTRRSSSTQATSPLTLEPRRSIITQATPPVVGSAPVIAQQSSKPHQVVAPVLADPPVTLRRSSSTPTPSSPGTAGASAMAQPSSPTAQGAPLMRAFSTFLKTGVQMRYHTYGNKEGGDVELKVTDDDRFLWLRSRMLKRMILQVSIEKITSVQSGIIPTYLQAVISESKADVFLSIQVLDDLAVDLQANTTADRDVVCSGIQCMLSQV